MSISNTGSVDLESVLNVRRRTLASIVEGALPPQQPHYSDTIYLKREDNSDSILSINSQIFIFGELQLLYSIFERYTSNIIVCEESIETNLNKLSFSATSEEDENIDEDDIDGLAIISTVRQPSISSQSSSSPKIPSSPIRHQRLSSIGRSQTLGSTTSDYFVQNLEGKRYGCIKLPTMTIIEILEILIRIGLELVDKSSDYDNKNVLYQNFIFTKTRQPPQRLGQPLYSRSSSFVGT